VHIVTGCRALVEVTVRAVLFFVLFDKFLAEMTVLSVVLVAKSDPVDVSEYERYWNWEVRRCQLIFSA
jgi:hypothetical protein